MISRHIIVIASVFAGLILSTSLFAQNEAPNPCSDIKTSQQVDECARNDYQAADQLLNDVYKRLMRQIDRDYKANSKLGDDFRSNLKKAQQAWLKYRDANCAVEAFEIEPSTIAHATAVNACLARMSSERTQELGKISK